MSEAMTLQGSVPETPPQVLACRLRLKEKVGRWGQIENAGEIELENLSANVVEVSYQMTPLQYLNLIVVNADGKIVSQGHFGDRFAPTMEPRVLRLTPGEKFTADVHLLATVPDKPIPPGSYSVHATYQYNGYSAVSDSVEVTV